MTHPTTPATEPDYWTGLADDLRQVADRIATLAGTGLTAPAYVSLNILGDVLARNADRTVPMVDAIAAAVGATASRSSETSTTYEASGPVGRIQVRPYTFVPKPNVVVELEAARARVAELEAQQTVGGTR